MSKQSSIVWIISQLEKQKSILKEKFEAGKWNDDRCSEIDNCIHIAECAREMHRQEIVEAWCGGYDEDDRATSNPMKYYNETFGGSDES